ncbi:MAG: glutathione transferase GstA [Steroidobacteraceae bacterium]|nr:glutathione transferase GstA [Steroidobacteraceae bacterium]
MKLYYLKGACSLASYIALIETGVKFDAVSVDRQTRKTSEGEDYNQVNPKGYVPALRLDNGEVLTENVVVLQYIADLAPEKKLAPPAGTLERYRLVEWLAFINSEVHKSVSPIFVPTATDDVKNFARANVTRRLDWLEKQLGTKSFLMGEQFTVADCYLFVVLGWLPHIGFDMSKWPTLKAYHARIAGRPATQRALEAEGLK